jgi:putative hydrolase of the HAD superfamily
MIKNIILDIGGVMFDDSNANIEKLLGRECSKLCKIAHSNGFKKSLLGEMTIDEHIEELKNEEDYEDLKYILSKENLSKSYPIMQDNFDYIMSLKDKGYKLFILSNITEDSYHYINDLIDFEKSFDGGIYSYQEHLVKPNHDIYNLVIDRYGLKKEETVFFDDREKNVIAANEVGIKSYVFKNINDIEGVINEEV